MDAVIWIGKHSRLAAFARVSHAWTAPRGIGGMVDHSEAGTCVSFGFRPLTVGVVHEPNTDRNRLPLINFGRPRQRLRCSETGSWWTLELHNGQWQPAR